METNNVPISPEPKPSPIQRLASFVETKRLQVAEKFGSKDWRTVKEVTETHLAFFGGVTLATSLAVLANRPELARDLVGASVKVVATSLGVASVGAEVWNMFRIWAIGQKQQLQRSNS